MIYLRQFTLSHDGNENTAYADFRRTCINSAYPFGLFPQKGLYDLSFGDITIFCGSNGSGKSTLLNVIAERLELSRSTPFNSTFYFKPFAQGCDCDLVCTTPEELRDFRRRSRIITSDDVFDHIIAVRKKNDDLDFKRQLIFDQKHLFHKFGVNEEDKIKQIDFEDPDSVRRFRENSDLRRRNTSASQYVRMHVGIDERTYSNGENGYMFFSEAIQPGGLYLLDEPENSLSCDLQLELQKLLLGMARYYDCQIIMSTHSPFLLATPGARIYDMDSYPVSQKRWTDIPSVRTYHDFFKEHEDEF